MIYLKNQPNQTAPTLNADFWQILPSLFWHTQKVIQQIFPIKIGSHSHHW